MVITSESSAMEHFNNIMSKAGKDMIDKATTEIERLNTLLAEKDKKIEEYREALEDIKIRANRTTTKEMIDVINERIVDKALAE